MNASDSRLALRELLPWYENGSLSESEHDSVRALLATDLEANRQRRELRVLREVLSEEPILATNMAQNLRRLHARLGTGPASAAAWFEPRWLALAALLALVVGVTTFFAGT